MARLIDDILAGTTPLVYPGNHFISDLKEWAAMRDAFKAELKRQPVPVLLIDNVAEYVYSHYQVDEVLNLPNIAPPFMTFWSEFRVVASTHLLEPPRLQATLRRVGVYARTGERQGDPVKVKARWAINFYVFAETDRGLFGPTGPLAVLVGDHGENLKGYPRSPLKEDVGPTVMSHLTPTLMAICFLHCKNVKLEEQAVSKPLAKKYHAHTGLWPTKYHTLLIEPLKQVLRREGNIEKTGIIRALHICRGHFAKYSEEGAGLFGKGIYGDFYIPQHARGKRKPDQEGDPPREIEIKIDASK